MFTKNNGLIVKIIAAVLVIAMIVVVAVIGFGAGKDAQAAADAAQNTANDAVNGLTDLADKMEKLEGAIADLTDKIANAEQPEVIDPAKWAEATANIPAALEALEEALAAIAVEYGFVADEEGNYADVWYVAADVAEVAEAAIVVAEDAIKRATSVEAQEAAIEAVKAALAPENFEKVDVKIANLIAAIEADGVTYADKELVDELKAAFVALADCCEDAQKAVEEAEYEDKAEELYEDFVADAVDVLTAEYKAAMDAFAAKTVTVALFEEETNVAELRAELATYGDIAAIEATAKFQRTLTKYNAKVAEVATLKALYDYVTLPDDEETDAFDGGFNAEMAAFLEGIAEEELADIAAKIAAFEAQINAWVDGTTYGELLENEENYNIIKHETLAAIKADFAAKTAALVEKAVAFVDAVDAIKAVETFDLTVVDLIKNATDAWTAIKANYTIVDALELLVDEDGDALYDQDLAAYKADYEAYKAQFNAITTLVENIEKNIADAGKFVFVNYQYAETVTVDGVTSLVDDKFYTITEVDAADFAKVFFGATSYQNVDGKLAGYIAAIDAAVTKLADRYEIEMDEETVAEIAAIELLAAKVDGINEVFTVAAGYSFDGVEILVDEIIANIWAEVDADYLAVEVGTIADQFAAADAAAQ